MPRPLPGEYLEYQANYIDLVQENEIRAAILHSLQELQRDLYTLNSSHGDLSYAEGKWTVKQVLQHAIDSERVFAYRAMCIARGEKKDLPGFDENAYSTSVDVSKRHVNDLCDEMLILRQATTHLFNNFTDDELRKSGSTNGYYILVNSIGYVLIGHWRHHWKILQDRYGVS